MSEISREVLVRQVSEVAPEYHHNQAVASQMAEKDVVLVSGASGVGKNTVIQTSIRTYSGLSGVVSDTSRAPRVENGKREVHGVHYNFRQDYDEIWREIEAGEYFQIAVPGTGRHFYGSRPEAYEGDCTFIVDVTAEEALKIYNQFPGFKYIYLIPTSRSVLEMRLDKRGSITPQDRKDRLKEAAVSLQTVLTREGPFQCIVNNEVEAAAYNLCEVVRYGAYDDHLETIARDTGNLVLRQLSRD
jgi:guanylate kinase